MQQRAHKTARQIPWPPHSSHKKVQLLHTSGFKAADLRVRACRVQRASSVQGPATDLPPTALHRLRFHKNNGKKVKNLDGTYAATWEEHDHKKRPCDFDEDDSDNAPRSANA